MVTSIRFLNPFAKLACFRVCFQQERRSAVPSVFLRRGTRVFQASGADMKWEPTSRTTFESALETGKIGRFIYRSQSLCYEGYTSILDDLSGATITIRTISEVGVRLACPLTEQFIVFDVRNSQSEMYSSKVL